MSAAEKLPADLLRHERRASCVCHMPVKQVVKGAGGKKKVTMSVNDQEQQEASVSSKQSEEVIHQIPSD